MVEHVAKMAAPSSAFVWKVTMAKRAQVNGYQQHFK